VPESTTSNGTITVKDDRMWFHGGTTDYVNITYTDTGVLIQNTTYIPNFYDSNGANITVNCSGNVTMEREVRYEQFQEFYWTKYLDEDKYVATVNFSNVLDEIIYDVYLYIAFAGDETPDYSMVSVRDVTNGVDLREGEHYDISAQGIHMAVLSMDGNTERLFTVTYYIQEETRQPKDGVVVINNYDNTETHNSKNYYYLIGQWVNKDSETFIGTIDLQFNFSVSPKVIAVETIDVWDETNRQYLSRDEFVYTTGGITITQDAVGIITPQSERTYKVYYLYEDEDTVIDDTVDSATNFLRDSFMGLPLGMSLQGIHIVLIILIGAGLISTTGKQDKDWKKRFWFLIFMSFLALMFLLAYFNPA